MGQNNTGIPDHGHLIIVPNSLIDQWHRELKTFFKPHSIDIFRLPSSMAEIQIFWTKEGHWGKSKHLQMFRVVLVAHSVSDRPSGFAPVY